MNTLRRFLIPILVTLAAAAALVSWPVFALITTLRARVPGLDRPPSEPLIRASGSGSARLLKGNGKPAPLHGSWPCFRGANHDNVGQEPDSLARQWPSGGPRELWSANLGEGHAGPAVHDGRVYLLDYDREASADALRCLSLADGQEIWRYTYPVTVKRNHGMSRTVPAVAEGQVVALGPKCHVTCVDAVTGEHCWTIDLVRQYGTTVPQWYAGQCPLIDGDRVVLAPAGKDALLLAVDRRTGKALWKTPNPHGWQMTHSSVMPLQVKDRKSYVYCGSGGVVGVDARDGKLLWETTDWKISIATVPSPVCLPDGRVFLSGGYNAGALMLQVQEDGEAFTVRPLFRLKAKQLGSTQQTPILYHDHLYGVREDKELVCLDLEGNVVWHSGPGHRFGLGPYLIADDLLFVLSDEGELTLAEASAAGYRQLSQSKVLEGPDAWGPMALAAGRLIVRDVGRVVCLDVKQPGP